MCAIILIETSYFIAGMLMKCKKYFYQTYNVKLLTNSFQKAPHKNMD